MSVTTQKTTNDLVRKEFCDIIKSENDDRSYKGLILNNHMNVLLISDPTTNKAAAALDVNIGNLYYILFFYIMCVQSNFENKFGYKIVTFCNISLLQSD